MILDRQGSETNDACCRYWRSRLSRRICAIWLLWLPCALERWLTCFSLMSGRAHVVKLEAVRGRALTRRSCRSILPGKTQYISRPTQHARMGERKARDVALAKGDPRKQTSQALLHLVVGTASEIDWQGLHREVCAPPLVAHDSDRLGDVFCQLIRERTRAPEVRVSCVRAFGPQTANPSRHRSSDLNCSRSCVIWIIEILRHFESSRSCAVRVCSASQIDHLCVHYSRMRVPCFV